jgi:hypothetical protein
MTTRWARRGRRSSPPPRTRRTRRSTIPTAPITASGGWERPIASPPSPRTLKGTELLIADGHHRYETARVYAEEIGGEGPHRYVLMCLVALQDPGLTIFPTHRLVRGLEPARQEALAATLREHFTIEPITEDELAPPQTDIAGPLVLGYIDAHFRRAFRLTLKDPHAADALLAPALRDLDTAVLEALILKGPLGLTDDDISHLDGLGYSRTDAEALALIHSGEYDAAFFLRPSPVVRCVRSPPPARRCPRSRPSSSPSSSRGSCSTPSTQTEAITPWPTP